jgi:hypothetical protein
MLVMRKLSRSRRARKFPDGFYDAYPCRTFAVLSAPTPCRRKTREQNYKSLPSCPALWHGRAMTSMSVPNTPIRIRLEPRTCLRELCPGINGPIRRGEAAHVRVHVAQVHY